MEKGGGMGTTEYDEYQPKSRPVKLSLIVQTTKYFYFLFTNVELHLYLK